MPEQENKADIMRRLGASMVPYTRGANMDDSTRALASEMSANRRVAMRKTGAGSMGGPASVQFATGRPRDPLFYWKQNNLPYDYGRDDELKRIREYCRLLYVSHSMVGSCIDIYSKYPLLGMHPQCKDSQIEDFHGALFFDEDRLNYDEFTVDMGREYWTSGEAWPLGTFNEPLGIWDSEELLHPDDVEVQQSPFLRDPRFFIRLPESLRTLIETRTPAWEYTKLVETYPELMAYSSRDEMMPVSSVLLRQYKFKADTFNKRGIPLLMRAMRPIMQEEMLNAAMDSIADRMYTPLVVARLGASASDIGMDTPWIPSSGEREEFMESLDVALAADFRVLVTNFMTQVESVFGRENMPDFSQDFDRVEGRILQTFGLSQTMLSGASSGQTYAADALNRDLVSQLLTKYQKMIASHFRQRALVVAEAQEHYDYEERGGKKYVKMEEILEVDEETGEQRIVEQPKLLVPELKFKTMNLQDEEAQRQFLEQLREAGVPVSIRTRVQATGLNFDEEIERASDETVRLAVAEQETRKETYLALRSKGLPIPQDLLADFQPVANTTAADAVATDGRAALMGTDPTVDLPYLAPTQGDLETLPAPGAVIPGQQTQPVDPVAAQQAAIDASQAQVPPESNEMRAEMPKAAALYRSASRMREIADRHYVQPVGAFDYTDDLGRRHVALTGEPSGMYAAPRHIGMRRYADHVQYTLKFMPMEKWSNVALNTIPVRQATASEDEEPQQRSA